ncbi:hypothetical protein F5876DRAFT_80843 [Lentinula aff. lateritia]|uniref:Uncharacterized protein n=1 Tax=Lentinula aff. lateritia TaxID=2804960 RepID=A0ACC1TNW1_9AGAR|nr:hypothetical protein F5876DRAFT_80843 [Lentinula aff. lateritia]
MPSWSLHVTGYRGVFGYYYVKVPVKLVVKQLRGSARGRQRGKQRDGLPRRRDRDRKLPLGPQSPGGRRKRQQRREGESQRREVARGLLRKGTGKQSVEAGDPDDGDNGSDGEDDDDDEEEWAPCEQYQSKKIPCLQQEGKRSTVICKPRHDLKVQCSYSGRPVATRQEGGSNLTGERIVVLESQMAQLLANNQQLRDSQIRTNTYQCHLLKKIDWLIMDAARGKSPPAPPITGPSEVPRKRMRVVDSDEEEVEGGEDKGEEEEEGEGEGEPAPKKVRSEKGKERAE